MFRNILVALDRSNTSLLVFETALKLARTQGATLVMLHVLSPETEESPNLPIFTGRDSLPGLDRGVIEIYQELWQNYAEKGLAMLRSYAEKAAKIGVTAESLQVPGEPSQVICDVADRLGADLVIVGRRGYSGLNELILGSVSNAVLHRALCSVLVVQPA
jgi:nucleotide-binding universal stress UspA family protein